MPGLLRSEFSILLATLSIVVNAANPYVTSSGRRIQFATVETRGRGAVRQLIRSGIAAGIEVEVLGQSFNGSYTHATKTVLPFNWLDKKLRDGVLRNDDIVFFTDGGDVRYTGVRPEEIVRQFEAITPLDLDPAAARNLVERLRGRTVTQPREMVFDLDAAAGPKDPAKHGSWEAAHLKSLLMKYTDLASRLSGSATQDPALVDEALLASATELMATASVGVIFNGETNCFMPEMMPVPWHRGSAECFNAFRQQFPFTASPFSFLNSGGFAGRAGALHELLRGVSRAFTQNPKITILGRKFKPNCDQSVYASFYLSRNGLRELPDGGGVELAYGIDTMALFFIGLQWFNPESMLCSFDKGGVRRFTTCFAEGSTPAVVHFNGDAKLYPSLSEMIQRLLVKR